MAGFSEIHRHRIEGRFYARLEGSEGVDSEWAPRNQEEARNAVIAYDAVHADWFASSQESFFVFDGLEERLGDYWSGLSRGRQSNSPDDPYEPVPAFRIEVSLRPSHLWFKQALELGDQWVELNLGESGEYEVDVYRGLFDPEPENTRISGAPRPIQGSRLATQLSTAFSMDSWPDASDGALNGLFDSLPSIEQLISFDVGQGSAICLARTCWCRLCRDALHLEDRSTVVYGDPSQRTWPLASSEC